MPRPSAAEKARRMMALLPLLTPGAELPLEQLAAAVGATPGQVADDIAALSMCGLPPYSPDELVDAFVDDDVVRVFAAPPALDRPLRLTAAEAAALAAALESCGHGPDDPLRAKLVAAASAPADADEIASALRSATAPGGLAAIHAEVSAALAEHAVLRIEYFSAGRGEVSVREVEPWSLTVDRGTWYVRAWCRASCGERLFRLDRVRSAERTGEHFQPPAKAAPVAGATPADGGRRAEVRFAGSRLSSRDWPGALFRQGPGDDTLAQVPYASPGWVGRRVAARLGEAEAISPREVRAEVASVARRALDELDET